MLDAVDARALRPLSIGELLDRAVTICIGAFVPLALCALGGVIALDVLDAGFGWLGRVGAYGVPSRGGEHGPFAFLHSSRFLIGLVVWPLVSGALVTCAASWERREAVRPTRAYLEAARRFPSLFVVTALQEIAVLPSAFVTALPLLVYAFVLRRDPMYFGVLGFALGTVLAVAVCVAGFVLTSAACAASAIAFSDCVLANSPAGRAIVRGFRSVVGRGRAETGRTLVFGAVLALVTIVSLAVGFGTSTALRLAHSSKLSPYVVQLVYVIPRMFISAAIATYFLDLRVREDGLDLRLAARALQRGE